MSNDPNPIVDGDAVVMVVHTAIPVNEKETRDVSHLRTQSEKCDEETGVIRSEDGSIEVTDVESFGIRLAWILANLVAIVYLLTNPLIYSFSHKMSSLWFSANKFRSSPSLVPDVVPLKMLTRENYEQEFWARYDRHFMILYWFDDPKGASILPAWHKFAVHVERQNLPVTVAMIDCKQQEAFCNDFEVTEYPTIRWHFAYSFYSRNYQGDHGGTTAKAAASYVDFAALMLSASDNLNLHQDITADDFRIKSVYDDDWADDYQPEVESSQLRILDDYFQDPIIIQNYAKNENWLEAVVDDDDHDDYPYDFELPDNAFPSTISDQDSKDDEMSSLNEHLAETLNFVSTA